MQVSIDDVPTKVKWISAQITGKIKSNKPTTEPALHSLVKRALGAPQQAPYFGHIMSGSRLIDTEFIPPKVYCITIKADGIPPSYEGPGCSITYELRIVSQIGQDLLPPTTIPIRFISPFGSKFMLESTQATAQFTIGSVIGSTAVSPFSLMCPFEEPPQSDVETFSIKTEAGLVAEMRLRLSARAGGDFTGVIDMCNTKVDIEKVIICIMKKEVYSDNVIEEHLMAEQHIPLRRIKAKRFCIPIPFSTAPDTFTDLFNLSYRAQFDFNSKTTSWKWSTALHIHPPELSLSIPRVLIPSSENPAI